MGDGRWREGEGVGDGGDEGRRRGWEMVDGGRGRGWEMEGGGGGGRW